ncbi:MAG: hypothetical protein KME17_01185 [Cyanosarcina radialis HA8281-LM2]|jgi:hypothetical protein|nr:hypothetical protein [Cyanosarcina radialis HA8281-LM2]
MCLTKELEMAWHYAGVVIHAKSSIFSSILGSATWQKVTIAIYLLASLVFCRAKPDKVLHLQANKIFI